MAPGDKIVVDGEKYLVLDYNKEEKEVTVEDESGEEQTFKCEEIEIEEIEKEIPIEDEESEEGEESNGEGKEAAEEASEEDPTEESYDIEGDQIHGDISPARKILEGKNSSQGMPKQPDTIVMKKGSSLSNVNMPKAQNEPKKVDSVVMKTGKGIMNVNMPHAGEAPKMTGVKPEFVKKDKTASGYTQSPQKHNMPQDDGTPSQVDSEVNKAGKGAMGFNMPHAQPEPKKVDSVVMKKGGIS